jgi:hypothetical protein
MNVDLQDGKFLDGTISSPSLAEKCKNGKFVVL